MKRTRKTLSTMQKHAIRDFRGSLSECALALGLTPQTVSYWWYSYGKGRDGELEQDPVGIGESGIRSKVEELQAENKRLRELIDRLLIEKKARAATVNAA